MEESLLYLFIVVIFIFLDACLPRENISSVLSKQLYLRWTLDILWTEI